MLYLNDMNCCGMREIGELSSRHTAEEAMEDFGRMTVEGVDGGRDRYGYYGDRRHEGHNFRYVVFSQAGARSKYGDRFAAFIQTNRLGDVIETAGRYRNPNTNRVLKAWIWTVNHEAVATWVRNRVTGQ